MQQQQPRLAAWAVHYFNLQQTVCHTFTARTRCSSCPKSLQHWTTKEIKQQELEHLLACVLPRESNESNESRLSLGWDDRVASFGTFRHTQHTYATTLSRMIQCQSHAIGEQCLNCVGLRGVAGSTIGSQHNTIASSSLSNHHHHHHHEDLLHRPCCCCFDWLCQCFHWPALSSSSSGKWRRGILLSDSIG